MAPSADACLLQNALNPTMPLKRMVTLSYRLAGTGRLCRSSLATDGGRTEYSNLKQRGIIILMCTLQKTHMFIEFNVTEQKMFILSHIVTIYCCVVIQSNTVVYFSLFKKKKKKWPKCINLIQNESFCEIHFNWPWNNVHHFILLDTVLSLKVEC